MAFSMDFLKQFFKIREALILISIISLKKRIIQFQKKKSLFPKIEACLIEEIFPF